MTATADDARGAHAIYRDCGASFLPDTPAQRRCLPCVRVVQADQLGRRREDFDLTEPGR